MSKIGEKLSENSKMSTAADEMRTAVILAGGTRQWDDTRESWLQRAAWKLGVPYQRARAWFYRDARRIDADEWKLVMRRLAVLTEQRERQEANHVALQIEIARLDQRSRAGGQQVGGAEDADTAGEGEGR